MLLCYYLYRITTLKYRQSSNYKICTILVTLQFPTLIVGNLEGGSFIGGFERWTKRVSLSVRAPLGDLGGGLSTRNFNFERWMKRGSRDGASLSEQAPWRGPPGWGGAHALGTLEDMSRKAPDMGISLHRGPFTTKGNLESVGGALYQGL